MVDAHVLYNITTGLGTAPVAHMLPARLDVEVRQESKALSCTGPPPLTAFLTFISRQSISHSYTHLILALGIVREPTVWGFITSKNIFDEK